MKELFENGTLVRPSDQQPNLVHLVRAVATRAGVYESGNEFVLQALGMSAGAGVALAIIRKLRAFVWAGYGLAVILSITIKDRRAAGEGEGIDKSPQKL